jgi:acyl carrier protein
VEVESKLRHFITREIMFADDDNALDSNEPLLGSGIIDSLGIMRLVSFIEEEFDIVVPEDQLVPEHFQSVNRLASFVERLQTA